MCLENGRFVSRASSNTIMGEHDFSKLIKGLEDVDSNSSIEPRWLEHPKILIIVTAVCQLVWGLQSFFLLSLALVQLLVNMLNILINMLVYELHNAEKLLNSVTHIVLEVVQHNGEGHHIVDVHFLGLIIRLQIDE